MLDGEPKRRSTSNLPLSCGTIEAIASISGITPRCATFSEQAQSAKTQTINAIDGKGLVIEGPDILHLAPKAVKRHT